MPSWLSTIGGLVLGLGGIVAAVVVFVNHVLTTRKLQLEIDSLNRRLKEETRTIQLPSPEQVDSIRKHLDAFQRQMASQHQLLEAVIRSEQTIGKAVSERALIERRAGEHISDLLDRIASATDAFGRQAQSHAGSTHQLVTVVANLESLGTALIEAAKEQVYATQELHQVASVVADALGGLRTSLDRVEDRMEGLAKAELVIRAQHTLTNG